MLHCSIPHTYAVHLLAPRVCARMAAMWLRLPAGRGFPSQGVAPPLSLLPSHPIRPASHILQAVWSLVFALSCNLLVLVLYEIVGIMDPG